MAKHLRSAENAVSAESGKARRARRCPLFFFRRCSQTSFHLPPSSPPSCRLRTRTLCSRSRPCGLTWSPNSGPTSTASTSAFWGLMDQSGQGFTQPRQPQSHSARIKLPVCASWGSRDLRPLRFTEKAISHPSYLSTAFSMHQDSGWRDGRDTQETTPTLYGGRCGDCWEE